MEFRTIPPDPKELPRIKLVWPPMVSASIVLVAWLAEKAGHQWNVHGDAIVIALLFVASLAVGGVASILSLASIVPALRRHKTLRTPLNLSCTAISAIFLGGVIGCFAYTAFRLASA